MKTEEYIKYLQKQDLPEDTIEKQMAMVGDFIQFLMGQGLKEIAADSGKEEVERYAGKLIVEERNTLENFNALRDYAEWFGNRRLYVALIELMDCHNAMAVLADRVEQRHGREIREPIFRKALPPLGSGEKERCAYTRTITERMTQQLTPGDARAAWFQVQHGLPAEFWHKNDMADRETYRRYRNTDEFLDFKRRERDALLTRLRDENDLWYTTVINDEVLEFIKGNPEMEVGRREGNKIYITKVPYNAVRYLQETDIKMKRYYACHCPLIREAILQNEPISPDVCYCSLGHASHYLAGLGQELEGEVLESAVKGDTRCRFVFYLPNKEHNTVDDGGSYGG